MKRCWQNAVWMTPLVVLWIAGLLGDNAVAPDVLFPNAELLGLVFLGLGIGIRVAARGRKCEALTEGQRLVTDGIYGSVRHPLYSGSFLIGLGLCFLHGALALMCAYLICFWGSHMLVIRQEEADLARRFPCEYALYRRTVPALFPSFRSLGMPRRVCPRRLLRAIADEADVVCLCPLAAISLVVWKVEMADTAPMAAGEALLLVAALMLGALWLTLKAAQMRQRRTRRALERAG